MYIIWDYRLWNNYAACQCTVQLELSVLLVTMLQVEHTHAVGTWGRLHKSLWEQQTQRVSNGENAGKELQVAKGLQQT